MKEQLNLRVVQTATPPERLVVREERTFRTNGESVLATIVTSPINIYLKSIPEKRGETYDMTLIRLINRRCPRNANAYIAGDPLNNYLPIVYCRI